MDTLELSILQQKSHNTFERNETIRKLTPYYSFASIGRIFGLSRQAIRMIHLHDKKIKAKARRKTRKPAKK